MTLGFLFLRLLIQFILFFVKHLMEFFSKIPMKCLTKSGEAALAVVKNKCFKLKQDSSPEAKTAHNTQQALSKYPLSEGPDQ